MSINEECCLKIELLMQTELSLLRIHPKLPQHGRAAPTSALAARGFVLNPGAVHELTETGSSAEVRVVFELPYNLSDTANWDVGVQLLWSEDGSELTRFGSPSRAPRSPPAAYAHAYAYGA